MYSSSSKDDSRFLVFPYWMTVLFTRIRKQEEKRNLRDLYRGVTATLWKALTLIMLRDTSRAAHYKQST